MPYKFAAGISRRTSARSGFFPFKSGLAFRLACGGPVCYGTLIRLAHRRLSLVKPLHACMLHGSVTQTDICCTLKSSR